MVAVLELLLPTLGLPSAVVAVLELHVPALLAGLSASFQHSVE